MKMTRVLAVLLGLAMLTAACGDSSSGSDGESSFSPTTSVSSESDASSDASSDDDGGSDSFGSNSGSDFCQLAREFDETDPFGDIASFDEDFFSSLDDILAQIARVAPNEIKNDLDLTRDAFEEFNDILAKHDYNLFDPGLEEDFANFDDEGLSEAGDRIDTFMESECGITDSFSDSSDEGSSAVTDTDVADDFADLGDNPQLTEVLMQAFNIDADLADCLAEELGEFDADDPDPAILTKEVCGTTLLEIVANMSLGGG